MFTAISFAAVWILMKVIRIRSDTEELKIRFPDCTMSNPNSLKIVIGTIIGMMLTQRPIETLSTRFFEKKLPESKFPSGNP